MPDLFDFQGHPCPTCNRTGSDCPRCNGKGRVPTVQRLEVAAREWMDQHPAIFRLFERFALRAAERGARFGIGQLTEMVRWEVNVEWRESEKWKINNNHRAYVARRLIALHPELVQFIETRRTKEVA